MGAFFQLLPRAGGLQSPGRDNQIQVKKVFGGQWPPTNENLYTSEEKQHCLQWFSRDVSQFSNTYCAAGDYFILFCPFHSDIFCSVPFHFISYYSFLITFHPVLFFCFPFCFVPFPSNQFHYVKFHLHSTQLYWLGLNGIKQNGKDKPGQDGMESERNNMKWNGMEHSKIDQNETDRTE